MLKESKRGVDMRGLYIIVYGSLGLLLAHVSLNRVGKVVM